MDYAVLQHQLQQHELDEEAVLSLLDWIRQWQREAPACQLNRGERLCSVDFFWPQHHDKPLLQVDGYGRIWFYHQRMAGAALFNALKSAFGILFSAQEHPTVSCLHPPFWQGQLPVLTQLIKGHF